MFRKLIHRRTALGILGLALSGCSFDVPVKAAHSDAAVTNRLPLSMGYLLTPEFVGYEQTETVNGGHELIFPIGKASQSAFQAMFAKLFASDRPLAARPSAMAQAQGVDAVIEPRLTDSSIQGPSAFGWAGTWYVTLGYLFLLSDPAGREIAHWQVQGAGNSGTGVDWTGLAGSDSAAAALSAALSDVENHFLTGFADVPGIHAWLKSKQMIAS